MRIYRAALAALLLAAVFHPVEQSVRSQEPSPSGAAQAPSAVLPTAAEQSGYRATATGPQVEAYLRQLAGAWTGAELTSLGQTVEGRPLWALVVEPQAAVLERPLTVLVLGGIHSGECDGKEAILALARDMAVGAQGDWWQSLRLIFVPNFNADANERRSPNHRPGQAGPQAMGLRENAQGLDLNRDFVKLESPEVRALVAAFNQYDVDVLIDTHTTNGSLHRYPLTYDLPHHPSASASIDGWLRESLLPTVTERLSQAGFPTFYYGNFDTEHRRWSTYGYEARYSTEYMGLRGRIGILAESYSYAPYQTRVEVSYAFVREVLTGLAEQADTVRSLIVDADARTQGPTKLTTRAELAKTADGIPLLGYQQSDGAAPKGPYGPDSAAQYQPKDYQVQLWNRAQPTEQVPLPSGYVIPTQHAWAVSRLRRHGIQLDRLNVDIHLDVEVSHIRSVSKLPEFQRHAPVEIETETSQATRTLHAGSYYVNTAQPLGILVGCLLEPESVDSLAHWNFFDPDIVVGDEYPVLRLRQALDPTLVSRVQTVEPEELITLEHLAAPDRTVDYSDESPRTARWLRKSSEYVVGDERGYVVIDAASGGVRPLQELKAMARKLRSLDAFSGEQADEAARINALNEAGTHGLVSHRRDLYYFDARADIARQLTHSAEEDEQLAELNPQGTRAAFVRDNNLWVVDCESTELKQLTTDGSQELLNGILDWVYQEELYGRGNFKAFWWNPAGDQLAFLRLDQTPVEHYQVSDSISYRQTLEDTRYPKAGDPLPRVSVWLVDVASGQLRAVDLSAFAEDDRLIGRATWSPAGELWLQILNRVQNRQDVVRVDPSSGQASTLFSEASPGWIELRGTPHFLSDGDFLWLSDLPEGRTHLFRVDAGSGKRMQLTSGTWDVSELLSVSDDDAMAFVTGNISHPTEQQLIGVDLELGSFAQITSAPGTHRVSVDAAGRYFIDAFSSFDSPTFTSVHSIDGELLRVIDAPISDRHEYLNVRPLQQLTITARDGVELQAALMLPPGFDELNPDHRLPVLFYVYGGPQAPTLKNAWGGRYYWWHQMLCQQGFAVVLCDNRSALGRGVMDTWTIRGDMGRVELQDLEDAVAWVTEQPWADAQRLGMWGWSYGGYFTAYAMTHSQLFAAGIAGAPVTDWRNYDAIYTERYMDLPQNNPEGYESSSAVKAAGDLHGRMLIIHGERDDNVHISNSLQLAHALQEAGKQFDLMIYPKNRHGIVDPQQKYHMQRLMTDFLQQRLKAGE